MTGWSNRASGIEGADEPPPLLPQADSSEPPRPARMASCADRSTNSRRDMPVATLFLPLGLMD